MGILDSAFPRKPEPVAKPAPNRAANPAPAKPEVPRFSIGRFEIARKDEHRGFLFCGAPGTGKSVAITRILDVIVPRGDSGFVADRDGFFMSRHYNAERGDAILNPFDARSVSWSPLAEFDGEFSADSMAHAIVPDGTGGAEEWHGYAQTILAPILLHCWESNLSNADVFTLAISAGPEILLPILAGSAAEAFVQEGNEKFLGSIRGVLGRYLQPFAHLDPSAGRDAFSIKRWVRERDGKPSAWLWFPYNEPQRKALAKLICACADTYAEGVIGLAPNESRRRWLVLDEFSSLGQINSIETFCSNARKYGGAPLLGLQAVSQMFMHYGEHPTKSILACLGSWLILRTPDADTADFLSKQLGDHQSTRTLNSTSENSGYSPGGATSGSSSSTNQQVSIERRYLPSQIQKLRDRHGILNLTGDAPIAECDLPIPPHREPEAEAFIPRPPRSRLAAQPLVDTRSQSVVLSAEDMASDPSTDAGGGIPGLDDLDAQQASEQVEAGKPATVPVAPDDDIIPIM